MSLGHPSYPRPKGTRNHSMAEKRGYVEIGETGPRKTRVAWSKLDRLNPNPDRGLSYSVVRPIEHDVIECRPFPFNEPTKSQKSTAGTGRIGHGGATHQTAYLCSKLIAQLATTAGPRRATQPRRYRS